MANIVAHSGRPWLRLAALRPIAPSPPSPTREVAALAVVRRGEGQADDVAAVGEEPGSADGRRRRHSTSSRLASTDASSSRAAGSLERSPATVANVNAGTATRVTRNSTGGSPRPSQATIDVK